MSRPNSLHLGHLHLSSPSCSFVCCRFSSCPSTVPCRGPSVPCDIRMFAFTLSRSTNTRTLSHCSLQNPWKHFRVNTSRQPLSPHHSCLWKLPIPPSSAQPTLHRSSENTPEREVANMIRTKYNCTSRSCTLLALVMSLDSCWLTARS